MNKYLINGLTIEEINEEFNKIKEQKVSVLDSMSIPICITLDLSGSMNPHIETIKNVIKTFNYEFELVKTKNFFLIIMGIYESTSRVLYLGPLSDFNCDKFVAMLPEEGSGNTPLAECFTKADMLLKYLSDIYEDKKMWHTIPFFFSVTDNASTDQACLEIIDKFRHNLANANSLLVEFVTCQNKEGFKLDGYKIRIDNPNSQDYIKEFLSILSRASDTATFIDEDKNKAVKTPSKTREREAYNRYKSDVLLFNFRFCYEQYLMDS